MRSLNARVTLGAGIVLAVFIALSAFALERAFRDSARSARQERLLAQVYLVMAAAEVGASGQLTLAGRPSEPRLEVPGSGLYAAILDGQGEVIWRSRSAVSVEVPHGGPLPTGREAFERMDARGGVGFLVERYGVSWATPGGNYPFTFSVAEDLAPFEQQLGAYRRSLWGWLGAMALLLLLVQWLLLRWGLSPLRKAADELNRLERGEQDRIAGEYPTEVQRLTDNLNALLAHERAQQKRYRDALADLAHSLKTPLALVRGALRANLDADVKRTLDEQVERMDRTVGYHLQRAAASGRSGLAVPQPVRAAVERVATALAKVYGDKGVDAELDLDPALRFRGDEGDLTELVGNLLDNAFKWCRRRVRVSGGVDAGRLRLEVEDDGPGIPPGELERVLERGARADQSVPGHGIGLAVTREIVQAYGGSLRIGSSPLGGASVTLTLPGAG